MKKEEIEALATEHADLFAITHSDEDWHSHYYGFIYGFQKAQNNYWIIFTRSFAIGYIVMDIILHIFFYN